MIVVNKHLSDQTQVKREKLERYLRAKRLLSLLIGIPAFLVLIPLGIVISAIIMLDDPKGGSPIFVQDRLGRGMKKFKCLKFRTMRKTAPHDQPTNTFVDAEAHITRVGKFLRKTSIDELPQLWNVIKGDMSLVGPRPLVLCETDVHERRNMQGIYSIRPGLTGWAQIKGRDNVSNNKKVDLDYEYFKNISFQLDLRIFFGTFIKIISMDGIVEGKQETEILHGACVVDAAPIAEPLEDTQEEVLRMSFVVDYQAIQSNVSDRGNL